MVTDTPVAAPSKCAAAAVVGGWRGEEGTDFEEITFENDGRFSSFLHARPFEDGRWRLEQDVLMLDADNGMTTRIEGVSCGAEILGRTGDGALRLTPIH